MQRVVGFNSCALNVIFLFTEEKLNLKEKLSIATFAQDKLCEREENC